MSYRAPVADFQFILNHIVGFDRVRETALHAEATRDVTDAILTEIGRFCEAEVAPLQRAGDLTPARLENGVVRSSPGFAQAYAALAEGGWMGLAASPDHGGMGLPSVMNVALNEMLAGGCIAFQLCPLLSQGQIEALEAHASDALKATYLPKLISGEWTGTMNLTEPQAGSDVGALTTRAVPNGDGSYAITGQKIFVSWGDHDMTDNILHLVLARLPEAAPGTKGLSLFLVPKFLPEKDNAANSVRTVSLEHKLGLHGSPTAVLEYDGATGWMVGAENGGMAAMFTMMNNARLGTGVQSIGVAEAATQAAVAFAAERRQGRAGGTGTIIEHADVRRMLATMRAETFAMRALALATGVATDLSRAEDGDGFWAARAALLTPITKAYCTGTSAAVADLGIQVHGGMGFIEETGAAQFLRDVRVTSIYEGTNGIQAMDLVGRKMMDGGEAAGRLLDEVEARAEAARDAGLALAGPVWEAAESLREATEWLVQQPVADRFVGATAFLRAFARVLGAEAHLAAALAEGGDGPRTRLAEFYIHRLLPEHAADLAVQRAGDLSVTPADLVA